MEVCESGLKTLHKIVWKQLQTFGCVLDEIANLVVKVIMQKNVCLLLEDAKLQYEEEIRDKCCYGLTIYSKVIVLET